MRRITNFAIVEITPIGIQNIGWKFWIVWTVTNAAFLPILYFVYPETGMFSARELNITSPNNFTQPTGALKTWTHITETALPLS